MNITKIRDFRRILRKLERILNDQLKNDICCCGVSLAQCHAILEIDEQGEVTIGQLAKSLALDKSTLSRTIDGLFNIGLVTRVPHHSDRRCMVITLSEQGKETCKEIHRLNDEYSQHVFHVLPDEKHEMLVEQLGL